MPILSYLHQLFNADKGHAYLHTLRWQDRPLHCPRCHSHDVNPWGTYHYRPGYADCPGFSGKSLSSDVTQFALTAPGLGGPGNVP